MQGALKDPLRKNYVALQLALAGLFGLVGLLVLLLLIGETGGLLPFLLGSVASVLPVPVYVALILWVDRHEKEPGWLLLATFLWGSTVALLLGYVFNTLVAAILQALLGPLWATRITFSVVTPLVEETAKGVALLGMALAVRDEFDNLTDGLVYGALVGLGFGVAENVFYLGRAFKAGGLGGLTELFFLRVILLGLMHSIWTGCTGAGVGYARERGGAARFLAPVAGYVGAVFLHALWNSANVGLEAAVGPRALLLAPVLFGVILLPGILLLGTLAYLCERREREVLRSYLLDLVTSGELSEDELRVVAGREKSTRLWRAWAQKGPSGWLALRQFYDALAELAFARWRAAQGRPPGVPEEDLRARVRALREQVQALGLGG